MIQWLHAVAIRSLEEVWLLSASGLLVMHPRQKGVSCTWVDLTDSVRFVEAHCNAQAFCNLVRSSSVGVE